jgi:hypothetical protein
MRIVEVIDNDAGGGVGDQLSLPTKCETEVLLDWYLKPTTRLRLQTSINVAK